MKEIEITIDTEEIANYLYTHLAKRGYAPGKEEVEDLADIFFDYLIDKEIIEDDEEEY